MLGRGARPDIQSNDGTTPLILAAQIGWREGAEQLLARRANPNLGNSRGETPLIFAVQRRDLQMVRLLLSQRADPNQTDNVAGYSAIDYARQDRRAAAILRELEQRPRGGAASPGAGPSPAQSSPASPGRDRRPAGARRGGRSAASRPCGGRRRAAGTAPRAPPRRRSGRRRSGRRNRGRAPSPSNGSRPKPAGTAQ